MVDLVLASFMQINDTHSCPLNRKPEGRSDSYHEDCAWEWNELRKAVAAHHVRAVIHTGDVFHIKNSAAYAPRDLLYYSTSYQSLGVPVYVVPGNHDMAQSSLDNFPQSAFRALLQMTPNMHNVMDCVRTEIVALPPLTGPVGEGTVQVHIAGLPFHKLEETFETQLGELNARLEGKPGFRIAVLHIDMMPAGASGVPGHWAMASYDDVLDMLPNADFVCVGHIHHSYPLYTRVNPMIPGRTQTVAKPYSMGRMAKDYFATVQDLLLQHRPAFTLIQFVLSETGQLDVRSEYHFLPHVPFERAFMPESLERELAQSHKMQSVREVIAQQHGSVEEAFAVRSPDAVFSETPMSAEVKIEIETRLETASTP